MPQAKRQQKSVYSVHPGVAMIQKWIVELPDKTGKTLEQWIAFIRKSGPADLKARRAWLKEEHGLGTNTAWWLAERAEGTGAMGLAEEDPETYLQMAGQYVEAMFAGGKAGLRPLYDELLHLGLEVADDVKACPCKTIVPLYRNHVFAQIKPATRTRIDLGLALGKAKGKLPARLIDTGGLAKKDRITHRIPISRVEDIDDEVKRWLRAAYDLDA
ncbi:MAG TPA: DUF5655 domain-containing protein [Gemmataceae bacterium]|nr:DUF5655 domain-containing protein [Gemmataceae bacterium]